MLECLICTVPCCRNITFTTARSGDMEADRQEGEKYVLAIDLQIGCFPARAKGCVLAKLPNLCNPRMSEAGI